MKCSQCYASNDAWATVCQECGQAVMRLELCSAGHLLPPGSQDCPICPSLWPDVTAFAGPPLLRGLLWVVAGRLITDSGSHAPVPYLEVRDGELPVALAAEDSGRVELVAADAPAAVCRVLMRPEGVQICNKSQPASRPGPAVYTPLLPGQTLTVGRTTLRYLKIPPPTWARKLAGSR